MEEASGKEQGIIIFQRSEKTRPEMGGRAAKKGGRHTRKAGHHGACTHMRCKRRKLEGRKPEATGNRYILELPRGKKELTLPTVTEEVRGG